MLKLINQPTAKKAIKTNSFEVTSGTSWELVVETFTSKKTGDSGVSCKFKGDNLYYTGISPSSMTRLIRAFSPAEYAESLEALLSAVELRDAIRKAFKENDVTTLDGARNLFK
tara:strand:+ start:73 stop:411 length:339 start_codon:yes stop_codon:yes gene_type:complete